jgi:hypothetical protein
MSYYHQLHSRQFSEEELEKIMERAEKKHVYRTQKLSMRFIVEYILNPDYDWCVEDSFICLDDVLYHQRHLTHDDYVEYMKTRKPVKEDTKEDLKEDTTTSK